MDNKVRLWELKGNAWTLTAELAGQRKVTPTSAVRLEGATGTPEPYHKGAVAALAFSPDGNHLVSVGEDATIRAWSLVTKQTAWEEEGHSGPIQAVAYSPNGTLVATGGADRLVAVWDAATGNRLCTLVGGRDEVRSVAFSRESDLLAAGSRDFQIRVWNVPEFTEREVISDYNDLYALGFLPKGRLVFGAQAGGIVLRPMKAAEHQDILPCRRRIEVTSLAFSAEGSILAALGGGDPSQIRLWSLTRDHAKEIEPLALKCVAGAMAASRGGLLAVGDQASASVYLFDLPSRRPRGRLDVPRPRKAISGSAAFSPSGKRLAMMYSDGTVVVWDVEKEEVVFDRRMHQQGGGAVCFCGDEGTLLTGGFDCTARLWDLKQEHPIYDFGRQADWVVSTGSSHDGGLLAAGIWADATSSSGVEAPSATTRPCEATSTEFPALRSSKTEGR